ncbi:MAG: hypothetical protein AAFW65_04840 [Pseudomonadota bacterium]
MIKSANFRGASGTAYSFKRVNPDSPWARESGVALFAAPDAFGWRIIRMVEVSGREHDVRPLWAHADAERYGATAVFVLPADGRTLRRGILTDLSEGLTPVCATELGLAVAA